MMETGRISNVQIAMITILIVIGTTILFVPTLTVSFGGRDAWLAPLAAGSIGALDMWALVRLHRFFPQQTPVQYLQTLFGKWIGSAIACYMVWISLRLFSTVLREFSDFTIAVALPRTPPEVLLLLMLAVTYYGVRCGLEVLMRVAQFVIFVELIQLVFSVIALASKDIEIGHLFPLFEHGPIPFLRSSMLLVDWYGEILLVSFLLPFVRKSSGNTKAGLLAIAAVTVLLMLTEIYTIGVFGDVLASRMQFGLYEVARYISVANFLERLDPIVMGVWIMLIYCKLSIICYVTSLALAQLLRLQDYRPVIGPLCLIAGVMSQILFASQPEMLHYFTTAYAPYAVLVEFLFPLGLLGYAALHKRLRERHA